MIIVAKFTAKIDVANVARELVAKFPGTTTVSDDYYRDRIASAEHIATDLGLNDQIAPLECLRDVASRVGLQYHLSIPVTPESTVDVRIDRNGMLVCGDAAADQAVARRLVDAMSTFPIAIVAD